MHNNNHNDVDTRRMSQGWLFDCSVNDDIKCQMQKQLNGWKKKENSNENFYCRWQNVITYGIDTRQHIQVRERRQKEKSIETENVHNDRCTNSSANENCVLKTMQTFTYDKQPETFFFVAIRISMKSSECKNKALMA